MAQAFVSFPSDVLWMMPINKTPNETQFKVLPYLNPPFLPWQENLRCWISRIKGRRYQFSLIEKVAVTVNKCKNDMFIMDELFILNYKNYKFCGKVN